ncbi:MAG: hypothetical protein PHH54_05375 [Candidatus Nanoarchaeia archaeon]|nr:hypothetical protein [Candidatus Nanoarchaeia archaeon]MDD5741389.1 hypothetical protein [Candidatus Nanoarchaeia archaeon]
MKNYQEQLSQKIENLWQGIGGMKEVDKSLKEEKGSNANVYLAFAACSNYAKLQVLLEIYNQNFHDENMRELEKTVNEYLKSQEEEVLSFSINNPFNSLKGKKSNFPRKTDSSL